MSPLRQELDRYLAVRRSLGYDLDTSARVLRRFIAFAESQNASHITPGLFLRWQANFGAAGRQTWAARLGIVRLFAQWLHGLDPAHEPPPAGLIPQRTRRSRPYIYSEAEIGGILAGAAALPSAYGLRGLTYATLFGLIAATGLPATVGVDFHRARQLYPLAHRLDPAPAGMPVEAHLVACLRAGRHHPTAFGRPFLNAEGAPQGGLHPRLEKLRRGLVSRLRRSRRQAK